MNELRSQCNSTQHSKQTHQAMEIYDEYVQVTKREEVGSDDAVAYVKEIKKGDVFRSSSYKNMINQFGHNHTPQSLLNSNNRNQSDTRLEIIKNKLIFQKFKVELFN